MTEPVRLDDLISLVRRRQPDGTPLDHLGDAVMLGQHLSEVADHLIGHFVDQARRAGASWTEIGASMGVTKQAVQKRFVPRAGTEAQTAAADGFARFTDAARSTTVASQAEARRTGQDHIGTEHLVLGLLAEPDALAATTIVALGVALDDLRAAVEATLPPPAAEPVPELIPYTGPARKALELTMREALRLGHVHVGTEHVLLGVLSDEESAAARGLAGLGVTHGPAEAHIVAALDAS
jgi:hypothetical protein